MDMTRLLLLSAFAMLGCQLIVMSIAPSGERYSGMFSPIGWAVIWGFALVTRLITSGCQIWMALTNNIKGVVRRAFGCRGPVRGHTGRIHTTESLSTNKDANSSLGTLTAEQVVSTGLNTSVVVSTSGGV